MGNGECVVVVVMSCVRGRRQSSMGYRERCVERCGRKQPLSDNIIEARDVTNMPFESRTRVFSWTHLQRWPLLL